MKTRYSTLLVLGPPGSFSDELGSKLARKVRCCPSFKALFISLKKGGYALVPVKNKLAGEIQPVKRELEKSLFVTLEKIRYPVRFVIAALKKSPFQKIKKVYVASVAHMQCRNFLQTHCPRAVVVDNFAATSLAFKKIVQKRDFWSAAIGSLHAAKIYKMKILAKNIQDDARDWTEFAIITSQKKRKNRARRPEQKSARC